jgi:succinoglycan biosynthesis protein ExoA
MSGPLVSVVVPARDEERWIEGCLASIDEQDYPHHLIEVIVVVDSESTDATDVVADGYLRSTELARGNVVRNAAAGTPANLNVGLALARGDVLCRVDARSRIPRHYVARCVKILTERPDVAVAGGAQVAVAPRPGPIGAGIARALNNRWGMGFSRYRRGAPSGTSDTVYLGAFRSADLRAVGGWSRALPTNQDYDLNRRMSEHGVIWFDAELSVDYVPRPDLVSLHRQYVRFGEWKVRYWRRTGDRPRPRQLVLLTAPPVLLAMGAALMVRSSPSARVAIGASAVATAAVVEAKGARAPDGGVVAHVVSALALAAVATGWLRGAWSELARRREG